MKIPSHCLFATAGLAWLTVCARAQENQLEVDVRPAVVDKEALYAHKTKSPDEGGHSRIYGILSVQEVKAEQRMVKPVNENEIMQLLSAELNKNGFKLYAPGTKPEIILTVSYGRGLLQNPYYYGTTGVSGAENLAFAGGDYATSTIRGAFPVQLNNEKIPGYQMKLQKASFEKLYIRVVAWAYPSDPKAKSKMLWKTTMVVDDPDHRDLNKIAAKMLEAGAPYFDKLIREPEATVYKPVPDGRVNVGAPQVISPNAKKPN